MLDAVAVGERGAEALDGVGQAIVSTRVGEGNLLVRLPEGSEGMP